jgi:hypothetical protein
MRESTRLRSSNSSRLHRAFAPIANSSVDPPRHCGIEPRCSGHNQLRSRSAMHARSASAHAIAITRGVRLPVAARRGSGRESLRRGTRTGTPLRGSWSCAFDLHALAAQRTLNVQLARRFRHTGHLMVAPPRQLSPQSLHHCFTPFSQSRPSTPNVTPPYRSNLTSLHHPRRGW